MSERTELQKPEVLPTLRLRALVSERTEPQSWEHFWFLQDHIAWFGEREWHASTERISRHGRSTGPRERAGTQAIVRVHT